MATIENKDSSGKLAKGVTLSVTGAASENDAILAVENYLREHRAEGLALSVQETGDSDSFEIRLD
ncbi:hypothetical protein DYBT9623_00447 [Dyadobacter sp. CECT 9623]|uniref:Uncharacterized protein n=1 Tax=Dyadobacter linearis TaxID=2823330 RepID=A0ABM8UJV9_9BACT|nr:hypothetical protein [Dyadobacter sp. CECT 9623]CAG5067725.1 hypothetical protein DYBT9623_00447 [Dyadobacter sp. CECT 9623]